MNAIKKLELLEQRIADICDADLTSDLRQSYTVEEVDLLFQLSDYWCTWHTICEENGW